MMVSAGQEYDVTSGSEVVLDCYFHMQHYRMFDNPTVWEKTQLTERTRVNIMGVVQEPFASTRRFQVVFIENRPRYRLRLSIHGTTSHAACACCALCQPIAKFHYTGPTGPDQTKSADFVGVPGLRPGSREKFRAGPRGYARVRSGPCSLI